MIEYKGYRIEIAHGSLVKVMNPGKGVLPIDLRGLYTNVKFAQLSIDTYLEEKGTKDGKASSSR